MGAPTGMAGRCTVVVAAAGYGKTAAVRRWLDGSTAVSVGPDGTGARVSVEPDGTGARTPAWIVVDGRREPGPDEWAGFVEGLPGVAGVIVTARRPPRIDPRWRRAGLVIERGPADLALNATGTAALLRNDFGVTDPGTAARVFTLTAGWPALVRLAGARLAGSPETPVAAAGSSAHPLVRPSVDAPAGDELRELAGVLAGPGTDLAAFLRAEVLDPLPASARRLLRDIAGLGAVDESLCRAIGHRRAERDLALLVAIGVLVPGPGRVCAAGPPACWRPVPLLAHVVGREWPLTPAERVAVGTTAGDRFAERTRFADALAAYRFADHRAGVADLLTTHGPAWVVAGGARMIADAVVGLPAELRSPELRTLRGEALHVIGADDVALAELDALADQAPDPARLPPALAWRLGALHYLRADPRAAMAVFARGAPDPGRPAEESLLLAWRSAAHWMIGDVEACRDLADRALRLAVRADDLRARAAAQVAVAMHAMLVGDRAGNAAGYDAALRLAEACGDLVQAARIRVNRSSVLLEEARYPDALAEAVLAGDLAGTTGHATILATALCNEAAALVRLARLDEAAQRYERALAMFERQRSRKVAYPLTGLGDVHRWRGRPALARAAYEEALRAADAAGDLQGMVRALVGLARVVAGTDPAEA